MLELRVHFSVTSRLKSRSARAQPEPLAS